MVAHFCQISDSTLIFDHNVSKGNTPDGVFHNFLLSLRKHLIKDSRRSVNSFIHIVFMKIKFFSFASNGMTWSLKM